MSSHSASSESAEPTEVLKAAFGGMSDAILIVDVDSRRIEFCNPATAEMFGIDSEELIGSTTRRLHVSEQEWRAFPDDVLAGLREQGVYRAEREVRRADGTLFTVETVVTPLSEDRDGRPTRVISVLRDVSDRRREQQRMKLVRDISEAIAEAPDFESALGEVVAGVGQWGGCRYGEAWAPQTPGFGAGGPLVMRTAWGRKSRDESTLPERVCRFMNESESVSFEVGGGLPGRAWERGETVWLPDVTRTQWYRRADLAAEAGLHSSVAVPVMHDGEAIAVLVWYADLVNKRDGTLVKIVEAVVSNLGSFLHARNAEEALRVERDRFEQVAENIDDVLWLSRSDKSEIHYVSRAYEEIWQRSRESLYADPTSWLDAIHAADRERVRQALSDQRHGDYDIEYRVVQPGGEVRWVRDQAHSVEEGGEVVRVVGVARDITQRKEAERKLERSEEKFATAFQVNPLAMSIVTVEERRFLEVNEGFEEVTGYEAEEVLGGRVPDFGLWARPDDYREMRPRLEADGEIREYEARMLRKDGEIRHVLFSAQVIEIDGQRCVLSATQDITRRKRYQRELEREVLRDRLTGLANRRLFRDRLDHALQRTRQIGEEVAVFLLDLDRFKLVNDTFGHPAGDLLIQEVAERLKDVVRDKDTVARFGGDVFIILVEGVREDDLIEEIGAQLVEVFESPFELPEKSIHVTASIGVALSTPDRRDPDDLVRCADVALFDAKSPAGTNVKVYDNEGDLRVTERFDREIELREAVENRDFTVFYQPIVDLDAGRAVGVEALVRWEHAERGIISPAEFIPLSEETGLIVPLGRQVLEDAVDTLVEWRGRYPELGADSDFRLSVNLSARQYHEDELLEDVRQILGERGLPFDALVLEITESVLLTGHDKLQTLREEGVSVAIDDFGTGYSSLQYLLQLEADILKVDRGFVRYLGEGGRESALVEAILRLGRQLGLRVVAEGIETEQQRDRLVELGGTYGQGYYYARPMPAEEFEAAFLGAGPEQEPLGVVEGLT